MERDMPSAFAQEKSTCYELSAINFHLGQTAPRELWEREHTELAARSWANRAIATSALTGVRMTKAVLGVIGGSGIYELPGLEKVRQRTIRSPWGEPSAPPRIGEIAGTPVVFLSRHGDGH